MPSATPLPSATRSVAVVRALAGIGDMLCAVPALRSLRAGLPDARITLIGLPWAQAIVDRFPRYVDELVFFPGFPGIPEVPPAPRALPAFLAEMQSRRFDLALQMQGSGFASNPFTMLLGAAESAGFYLPAHYKPGERFIPYPADVHELQRLNALVRSLGMPDTGDGLEWPVTETDRADLLRAADGRLRETYAVVHAGANQDVRRWPVEGFVASADRVADAGMQVVLTGTAEDAPLTSAVAAAMRGEVLDLTGRTTLGALGALVAGARLVLCNDTGVSHIAAALGVPSVVVFSASDPCRWAPLDTDLHVAVHPSRQAYEAEIDVNEHCLRDGCLKLRHQMCGEDAEPVPVEAVVAAVERQLRKEGARVA